MGPRTRNATSNVTSGTAKPTITNSRRITTAEKLLPERDRPNRAASCLTALTGAGRVGVGSLWVWLGLMVMECMARAYGRARLGVYEKKHTESCEMTVRLV